MINWLQFKPIFKKQTFLEGIVNDMNVHRRVLAHMNPLPKKEVDRMRVAFGKWADHLKADAHLLP